MDAGTDRPTAPPRRRAPWMLLAVGLIALAAGAAGAYLGLHAARGAGSAVGAVPQPRGNAAAAYDDAAQQVVLFGGSGAAGAALDDTWTWDGSAWTRQHPPVSPAARAFALMTYDPQRHNVVLVGGRASPASGAPILCGASGSASASAAPPVPPTSPRMNQASPNSIPTAAATVPHAPVAPVSSSAAPCIGVPAPAPLTDTWLWDGSQWHATTASLPAGLVSDTPALATDPTTGQVMLLAQTAPEPVPMYACPIPSPGTPSASNCPAPVTSSIRAWTWNGSVWAAVPGSLPTPESVLTVGGAGALVADPTSGHLTSFRGGASVVCGGAQVSKGAAPVPCPLNAAAAPAASAAGSPPQVSGAPASGSSAAPSPPKPVLPFVQTGSATAWNGHSWSQPRSLEPSPSVFGTSFAGDPAQHSIVAYGGGTTWRWNGSAWTALQPSHTPGNLMGAAMVYDGSSGRVLLFGGAEAGPARPAITNAGYTNALWAWDGSEWSQVGRAQPPRSPSPAASSPATPSPMPTVKPGSTPTPALPPSASPCAEITAVPAPGNRGPASPAPSTSPSMVPGCPP